jgi:hypothetical protein
LEQLAGLVPEEATKVGTVWTVLDSYRVKVQIPTGDFMVIKGQDLSINDKVLFRGTQVVQKVPSLPSTTQELLV